MKKDKVRCSNKDCSKDFSPRIDTQEFCSKACSREDHKCPNCKRMFKQRRSNQNFCSRECRIEHWGKHNTRRFVNMEKLERICIKCPCGCGYQFQLSQEMLEQFGMLGRKENGIQRKWEDSRDTSSEVKPKVSDSSDPSLEVRAKLSDLNK